MRWWILVLLLLVPGLAAGQDSRVTVGLFAPSAPFAGPEERLAYVSTLAEHLAARTGRPVVGRVYARPGDFQAAVKRGEVQFAVVDAPYVAGAGLPYRPLAAVVRGGSASAAWELVAGPEVRGLADLAGKTVVVANVGGKESAFVVNALLEGEVSPSYFAKITAAPDAVAAVATVNLGRADAALVPGGLTLPAGQHRVASLRSVGWPMFAALPGSDEATAAAFAAALPSFRSTSVFTGFTDAGAADYPELGRAFAASGKRGPLAVPPPARLEVKGVLTGRSFTIRESDLGWTISAEPARKR